MSFAYSQLALLAICYVIRLSATRSFSYVIRLSATRSLALLARAIRLSATCFKTKLYRKHFFFIYILFIKYKKIIENTKK